MKIGQKKGRSFGYYVENQGFDLPELKLHAVLAGGEEETASVNVVTIISMRTTPAWKAILAGCSCLHKYFLRTVYGEVIIKEVGFELLLR